MTSKRGNPEKGKVAAKSCRINTSSDEQTANWTGIIRKQIVVTEQQDEATLQAFLIGDLFTPVKTKMEPSLRRVGNQKGFDSLSYHDDAMLVRSIELLNLNIEQDATFEERVERNQLVHGANILRDLEALDYYKDRDPPRVSRMQKGFEVGYGISPSIFDQEIGQVPDTVIFSLNLKRDLMCLRIWARVRNQYPNVKTAMLAKCNLIIEAWQKSIHQGHAYPEAEMSQAFQTLHDLYSRWL